MFAGLLYFYAPLGLRLIQFNVNSQPYYKLFYIFAIVVIYEDLNTRFYIPTFLIKINSRPIAVLPAQHQ